MYIQESLQIPKPGKSEFIGVHFMKFEIDKNNKYKLHV